MLWGDESDANGEGGFTIIEMMVALSVMTVAMVAMSGVFFTGLRAASASATRTSAVALATRETEAIRAVPYESVGFYGDQPDYMPTFEGLDAVSLGAVSATASPPIAPRLAPTGSEPVGPVTYSIIRHISWVDAKDASNTYGEAYKKTVVLISWSDGSGPHTVRQDSIVYPGGLGPHGGGPAAAVPAGTVAPAAPFLVSVTTPADPVAGQSQLDLLWNTPAGFITHYIVQWSTSPAFSTIVSSPEQPSTENTYSATGLAQSTTYYFRVIAYAGSSLPSAPSNVEPGTTLAAPAPLPCSIKNLSISGTGNVANQGLSTKTYLQNGNDRLKESLDLVVSTSGTCSGSITVGGTAPGGSADPGSPYIVTGSGGTYSGTIGATNISWANGQHSFVVRQNNAAVDPPVVKTYLFCAHTSSPSANANEC